MRNKKAQKESWNHGEQDRQRLTKGYHAEEQCRRLQRRRKKKPRQHNED